MEAEQQFEGKNGSANRNRRTLEGRAKMPQAVLLPSRPGFSSLSCGGTRYIRGSVCLQYLTEGAEQSLLFAQNPSGDATLSQGRLEQGVRRRSGHGRTDSSVQERGLDRVATYFHIEMDVTLSRTF